MRLLIQLGADPKLSNKDSSTPLLAACGVGVLGNGDDSAGTEEESIQAVSLLLEQGADIDAVDDNGNSAMHGTTYKDRLDKTGSVPHWSMVQTSMPGTRRTSEAGPHCSSLKATAPATSGHHQKQSRPFSGLCVQHRMTVVAGLVKTDQRSLEKMIF